MHLESIHILNVKNASLNSVLYCAYRPYENIRLLKDAKKSTTSGLHVN
jgi:hypothetical protein